MGCFLVEENDNSMYMSVVVLAVITFTFTGGNYFSRNKKKREGDLFLCSSSKMNLQAYNLTLYFPSLWIHLYHKYS